MALSLQKRCYKSTADRAQEEDTTFAVALQGLLEQGGGLLNRTHDQKNNHMHVMLVQVSTTPRVHGHCSTGSLVFLHRPNCSPRADAVPLSDNPSAQD